MVVTLPTRNPRWILEPSARTVGLRQIPRTPQSKWSDDWSLGVVFELGYHGLRRNDSRATDTVGLLVGDVRTICMRSNKPLLRTAPTSVACIVSYVSGWRTCDMGFVAPQTCANDEI